jgi:hypothetical protein
VSQHSRRSCGPAWPPALAPDVILTAGDTTLPSLLQTTSTVPIVFAVSTDPVGAGWVNNLARPGGNTTGIMVFEFGINKIDMACWAEGDVYVCPGGKMLTTTGSLNDGATLRHRASKYDCQACRLKPRCCPKEPARYVPRSIYEGARDMARRIARSWEGQVSRRLRKKVEMLFAHLKRILKLDRLRLRGPNGAHDEFLLAATAQNLRKLAKLIPVSKLQAA